MKRKGFTTPEIVVCIVIAIMTVLGILCIYSLQQKLSSGDWESFNKTKIECIEGYLFVNGIQVDEDDRRPARCDE